MYKISQHLADNIYISVQSNKDYISINNIMDHLIPTLKGILYISVNTINKSNEYCSTGNVIAFSSVIFTVVVLITCNIQHPITLALIVTNLNQG